MQGVWNGCKKTAKGFDEVFSVTSAEAMEDLRAMAPAMLALLKLTADFSRRLSGGEAPPQRGGLLRSGA